MKYEVQYMCAHGPRIIMCCIVYIVKGVRKSALYNAQYPVVIFVNFCGRLAVTTVLQCARFEAVAYAVTPRRFCALFALDASR